MSQTQADVLVDEVRKIKTTIANHSAVNQDLAKEIGKIKGSFDGYNIMVTKLSGMFEIVRDDVDTKLKNFNTMTAGFHDTSCMLLKDIGEKYDKIPKGYSPYSLLVLFCVMQTVTVGIIGLVYKIFFK